MSLDARCELCAGPGGELIWSDARCRVIRVDDANFPGFCRVVWNTHVAELSELAVADRNHLINVVCAVEAAVREVTQADKINLASLGNVVPHLHWHVIPRWRGDSHFPQPVWASPQRTGAVRTIDTTALANSICRRLATAQ
jgi:diadenosine tetraphosphate (Ap4A) HIT family hydrolase